MSDESSFSPTIQARKLISQAKAALQQGDKLTARRLAQRAAALAPDMEETWLWLAAVSTPEASVAYLKRALQLNPQSKAALAGLAWAEQRLGRPATTAPAAARPAIPESPPLPVIQAQPAPQPAHQPTPQPAPQPTPQRMTWLAAVSRWLRHINWPLLLGGALVLFFVVAAIWGTDFAPKHPMEEHYAERINGVVRTPPYAAFTVPEYPLGTDRFGRDLLSRLLYAIRPTLTMVFTVALVRLGLGILLGLAAGWYKGRISRWLDSLISGALSLPVLLVALVGIAAIGVNRGLIAFIVGLALTGWAETARMVSEQTRSIKGQVYIEAAQALGASGSRILFSHVLPQIMPLLWMLLAFEIGGTLLVVSELGFLGYFIGGGVWIEVFDFTTVNAEGLPELGQMLSIALVKLTEPTALMVVGGTLFFAILGFNLLGIGLKNLQAPENAHRRRRVVLSKAMAWLEEKVTQPSSFWLEEHARPLAMIALLVAVTLGGLYWWNQQPAREVVTAANVLTVPGGHLWAAARHDPQGSLWAAVEGPKTPILLWDYYVERGFPGGPVIAADGTIYILSFDGDLTALTPDGRAIWQVYLPDQPVGSPALGADGEIYAADRSGGLTAFNSSGDILWSVSSGRNATSGPVVGPNGDIYYTLMDTVQAVSARGEKLWSTLITSSYLEIAPRVSAAGSFVFLKDVALAADSGAKLAYQVVPGDAVMFTDPMYFVGADRGLYYRSEFSIYPWRTADTGLVVDAPVSLQVEARTPYFPADAGVSGEELVWMLFSNEYADTRLYWMDLENKALSYYRTDNYMGKMIGVDRNSVAYLCSPTFQLTVDCAALKAGEAEPLWEINVGRGQTITGGAITDGRMYVMTKEGYFYVLGDR